MINFFNVFVVYKPSKLCLCLRFSNTQILVLATVIAYSQLVGYKCILSNCACKLCLSVVNRARSSANNSENMDSLFMSCSVRLLKSIESLISFTNNKNKIGESGSPCFRPTPTLKQSDNLPSGDNRAHEETSAYKDCYMDTILQVIILLTNLIHRLFIDIESKHVL